MTSEISIVLYDSVSIFRYNPHFVKIDEKPIVIDGGVICYHNYRELSLSTYLQQPIGNSISPSIIYSIGTIY